MLFSKPRARLICEAHDIKTLYDDEEEWFLLTENNPDLAEAYLALLQLAGLIEYRVKQQCPSMD